MNAILGLTELVLDTRLTPSQREHLRIVKESGESLMRVINDILDFSKIEAGKLDLEEVPFGLRERVGDIMKSMALRAHDRGLELACRIAPDVPDALLGDPARLGQILVNLTGNAIKFTEEGEIVLEVGCEEGPPKEAVLRFSVSDTGVGIPESLREKIFDAFSQADRSTTRRYGGTGLGLTISARLVAMLGGRIWVDSTVGRGSTFHFTARFRRSSRRYGDLSMGAATVVQAKRVLLVDDNATNLLILEETTRRWGMTPVTASNAKAALEDLQRAVVGGEAFDLLVCDVCMPDVSGITLAEWVRADPELSGLPIIALTSGVRPQDLESCEKLQIAARLMKPVKQSELFDAVIQALGFQAPREEGGAGAPDDSGSRIRPLRILLAEDSLVNQKLAVSLLERKGHQVTVVENGKEAVSALEASEFDVVLMDLEMPGMDGLAATSIVRAREKTTGRHVPIIAMTAHAMKGDRERCLEAGMDNYVSKPVRAEELYAALRAAVAASGA
jgi:CheY-like chemotaxis protein